MSKKFANQISGRQPRKEALLLLLDSKQGALGWVHWVHHTCNKFQQMLAVVWHAGLVQRPQTQTS